MLRIDTTARQLLQGHFPGDPEPLDRTPVAPDCDVIVVIELDAFAEPILDQGELMLVIDGEIELWIGAERLAATS